MKSHAVVAGLAALVVSLASPALALTPTLKTITIDGDLSDWNEVLANPLNVTLDGDGSVVPCTLSDDRDCQVQSSGRDLRRFAWTYDQSYVYVYVERNGSDSNTQVFWHYFDLNGDAKMGIGDKVFRVRFSGSNGSTINELYAYAPFAPGGDPMVDAAGYADGYTLPGSLLTPALWSEDQPYGGAPDGSAFEERVPFSALGVSAGFPINFHVSSSNSPSPNNLAQQIDDNLGGPRGGPGTFGFDAVSISPPRVGTASAGGPIDYAEVVTNDGVRPRSFDLKAVSTLGLSVTFSSDLNGDGVPDETMAVDANGDGDFSDPGDTIRPGWDRDGDGYPDTPVLLPGATFPMIVTIDSRAGQTNATDVTRVTVFLATSPDLVTDSVTLTTLIGDVVLLESQAKGATPGQGIAYGLRACSTGVSDTFAITAVSTLGYPVALYSDPDCDEIPDALLARDVDGNGTWDTVPGGDTDGDGVPDTGPLSAGQCSCMVVVVTVPADAAAGAADVTTVQALGTATGAVATADLATTVGGIIEISPDYLLIDGTNLTTGPGRAVYFAHVVVNNGPAADSVDFQIVPPVSSQGWPVLIYSDPNGDGNIADGALIRRTALIAANGGTAHVVVAVQVPFNAPEGSTDTVVVTAVSVANHANSDTATDELRVSRVATYADPLVVQGRTYFGPCATIYVEVTGLAPGSGGLPSTIYSLVYVDASGRSVRIADPLSPDGAGTARDQYTVQPGDMLGTWRLELRARGLIETVTTITVEGAGSITLTRDGVDHPPSGSDVTLAALLRSLNVRATLTGTWVEYTVFDTTGTLYLRSGDPSTFVPYTGTEISGISAVPDLGPGDSYSDTITFLNVIFPAEGAYRVMARWTTPCGIVIAETPSVVVAGNGEDCANGVDDDGDGLADCADPECVLSPNCIETACSDGADNDGDTLVDCADPDCADDAACHESACADGVDNDGDGPIDCADSDCADAAACHESACSDGADNDGDGLVDCADPDCKDDPACNPETDCANGVDDDGDTLVDCADSDCAAYPACTEIINCHDGVDNDGDGPIDCADSDCATSPDCSDTDGDTVPDSRDCAPTNPLAFAIPPEVMPLYVLEITSIRGVAELTWPSVADVSGAGTTYDVITGLISQLHADRGFARADCLRDGLDLTRTSVLDPRPVPGTNDDGFYYLVRAKNACGYGPIGTDSFGRPRDIAPNLCP